MKSKKGGFSGNFRMLYDFVWLCITSMNKLRNCEQIFLIATRIKKKEIIEMMIHFSSSFHPIKKLK